MAATILQPKISSPVEEIQPCQEDNYKASRFCELRKTVNLELNHKEEPVTLENTKKTVLDVVAILKEVHLLVEDEINSPVLNIFTCFECNDGDNNNNSNPCSIEVKEILFNTEFNRSQLEQLKARPPFSCLDKDCIPNAIAVICEGNITHVFALLHIKIYSLIIAYALIVSKSQFEVQRETEIGESGWLTLVFTVT
ncbi:uncharacterized protein LOC144432501 isoform X2 [Glandiceps talaboti]